MKKEFKFDYETYSSLDNLSLEDRQLIIKASDACAKSYSPYSMFRVGAAIRLEGGEMMSAANQESEVFPAGICAERALLFGYANSDCNNKIIALAIASSSDYKECYPCGICRQTILDMQRRQDAPIRIIMASGNSATVVDDASYLTPFSFTL